MFLKELLLSTVGAGSLMLGGCATVPGADIAAGAPITPAEAQQGAEYHPQFLAEFGGEIEGLQGDYVERIGDAIAVQSGLAATPEAFQVTLLNSPSQRLCHPRRLYLCHAPARRPSEQRS